MGGSAIAGTDFRIGAFPLFPAKLTDRTVGVSMEMALWMSR
jgi:hypothetical protein